MVSPPLNPAYATDVHNKLVISVKWCKIETLLLPTTNRNWYNSISNRAISDDNEWPSKLFAYWMRSQMRFLLRQRERLRSIVMNTSVFVCVSVCLSVREDIFARVVTRAIFTIFVHVAYGRGSVLRRRCDTLCTSGFVDDIMFHFYNGPYSGMNFATKDRFNINLLICRKVGQNSISYY